MKTGLAVTLISLLLELTPQLVRADPNIYKSKNRIYYIEPKQKFTWSEALKECNRKQMALVTLDTKEKTAELHMTFKTNFLDKKKRIPRLYIGANDLAEFRKFIWVSTGKPFGFTNWEKSEPNNYQKLNERCVHMGFHGTDQWNDIRCSKKNGFICEQSRLDYDFLRMSRSINYA